MEEGYNFIEACKEILKDKNKTFISEYRTNKQYLEKKRILYYDKIRRRIVIRKMLYNGCWVLDSYEVNEYFINSKWVLKQEE